MNWELNVIPKEYCDGIKCHEYLLNMQGMCHTELCPWKKERAKNEV